jgi:DNA-binding transcriptional ArsR family regulator
VEHCVRRVFFSATPNRRVSCANYVSFLDETLWCALAYNSLLMNNAYPIAVVAELFGEPCRVAMLVALLDGRALPAGDLARLAGISAQSASGHLSKLVDGGLLSVRSVGRHRYYSIAGPEVARALEALGAISTAPRVASVSLGRQPDRQNDALYLARTCYDHLAGRVAVEITKTLEADKVIQCRDELNYELGARGGKWFADVGVDAEALRRGRRLFARQCIDWTERRPHLAGALGAALCSRFLVLGWVARRSGTRALRITAKGANEFRARFGIAIKP